MITIEEKEYDLKYLLHFDMLREILIKLAKNQNILQKDVESIKNSNKERDYKIMKLEKNIKEQEKDIFDEFEPRNNYIDKEDILKEKKEIDSQNNNININEEEYQKSEKIEEEEEKEEKEEKKEKNKKEEKEKNIEKEKSEQKEERLKNEKKTDNKKDNIKEDSDRQKTKKEDHINMEEKKINDKRNNYMNIINNDKNIMKFIRQLSSRINELENQLNSFINKEVNNLKKELKNHDLENQSDFKIIDVKMNEILEKLTDYDKKIEDCTVKWKY